MRTLEASHGLPALADQVWAQRSLATQLHYKLVVAGLVLASDRRELVVPALAEVEEAAAALAAAEQDRLAATAQVALAWGVPHDEVTLGRLADEAPDPWDTIFGEHRAALLDLTTEIEQVVEENRRLASNALSSVSDALGTVLRPGVEGYDASGRAAGGTGGPVRLDRAL